MKRFALFAGPEYYPGGGWRDFETSSDTLGDIHEFMAQNSEREFDWWHIVDTETGKIVYSKE